MKKFSLDHCCAETALAELTKKIHAPLVPKRNGKNIHYYAKIHKAYQNNINQL